MEMQIELVTTDGYRVINKEGCGELGKVAHMEKIRNSCNISAGKPERKITFGRSRCNIQVKL
jgi:hypothetical protein